MKSGFTIKIKTLTIIFSVIVFYIFLAELISRVTIYISSKDKNTFFYGLNKNIEIEIVDLSDLKFNINNIDEENVGKIAEKSQEKSVLNKSIIWTFGASLTYGFSCGESSSSWPRELENLNSNFEVKNFGFPSIYSDDSIKILRHNLKKNLNNLPKYIIWAHRDEEKKPIYYGLKRNKDKIKKNFSFKNNNNKYFLLTVNETLKSNLTFYMVMNHIIEKIKKRNNIQQNKVILTPDISEEDYLIAAENYSLNTIEANSLIKNYGIDNFLIVSLFDETQNDTNIQNTFIEIFNSEVKNISRDYNNIKFIDTFKYLNQDNKKEIESYFCSNENHHFNLKGNKLIAKIIHNFIATN